MGPSACNGNHTGKAAHLNRGGSVGRSAIPKLAIHVIAPCPDRAVIFNGYGVILSPCYCSCSCKAAHLNRGGSVGRSPIPKLAIHVIAPCPCQPAGYCVTLSLYQAYVTGSVHSKVLKSNGRAYYYGCPVNGRCSCRR